jgi:hypothetical protein
MTSRLGDPGSLITAVESEPPGTARPGVACGDVTGGTTPGEMTGRL